MLFCFYHVFSFVDDFWFPTRPASSAPVAELGSLGLADERHRKISLERVDRVVTLRPPSKRFGLTALKPNRF